MDPKGRDIEFQFLDILHHDLGANDLLWVIVEIFVQIVFEGIGRHMEKVLIMLMCIF